MRAGILLVSAMMAGWATPALAQSIQPPFQPPGQIPGVARPGSSAHAAQLLLRIDRLEKRVRGLTGEIEELQFTLRKQRMRLEKFEKDIELRLRGDKGSNRVKGQPDGPQIARAEPTRPAPTRPAQTKPAQTKPAEKSNPAVQLGKRKGDAFDPARQPDAVGVPRQLGTPRGSRPLRSRVLPSGPISDQAMPKRGEKRRTGDALPFDPDAPVDLSRRGSGVPKEAPHVVGIDPPITRQDANPRDMYRLARASLKKRRYGDAQSGFRDFLKRFPKSSLADDARYFLGDAYARNGKHRLAAEQFLKVSADHRKSPRAPYSLYRLGLALEKLGAKEQACASYHEVEKRYPLAPGRLRVSVERQLRRVKC